MDVHLHYGRRGLVARLPDDRVRGVLQLALLPPLDDPAAAVVAALRAPIARPPLAALARGRGDACVVICDVTRPVPNNLLLPPLLAELAAGGVPAERVTVLVATGAHRACTTAELTAMIGPELTGRLCVVNHDCDDRAAHRALGVTAAGTPVLLDERWCAAALKITVGLIEPHFMAGYSGGRKLLLPGIAARETIHAFHGPRFLEHPRAAPGVVDGNPVHEEALAGARRCPPDLVLEVTLDERNRVTGLFAGELEQAWRAGVAHAARQARATLPAPVDIVVTTGAGYPLDATFYQAVKGMVGALPILRPGGSVVLAAACAEGIGSADFQRLLSETTDLERFVEEIQRPGWTFVPDQWEVEELARAARRATIHVVCDGIPPATLARLHVTPAATVEEAVGACLARHGAGAAIAVIPRGPYVLPELAPDSATCHPALAAPRGDL